MANQVKTEEPDIKPNGNGNNSQESSGVGQEGTSTPNPVDKIVGTSEPSVSEKVELWMRQESYTAGISQAYEVRIEEMIRSKFLDSRKSNQLQAL